MRAVKGNLATPPGRDEKNQEMLVRRPHVGLHQSRGLARRLNELEKKYNSQFRVVFEAIRELMAELEPKVRRIGFNTDCWDTVDPSRTDLTSWADLQDLEEGRAVPRQEPVA